MNKVKIALTLPMDDNDADAATIKDYLKALLTTLWEEEEGFDGKRPFGNSGWQYDVYKTLVKFEIISGSIDREGYLETVDRREADQFVQQMIEELFK